MAIIDQRNRNPPSSSQSSLTVTSSTCNRPDMLLHYWDRSWEQPFNSQMFHIHCCQVLEQCTKIYSDLVHGNTAMKDKQLCTEWFILGSQGLEPDILVDPARLGRQKAGSTLHDMCTKRRLQFLYSFQLYHGGLWISVFCRCILCRWAMNESKLDWTYVYMCICMPSYNKLANQLITTQYAQMSHLCNMKIPYQTYPIPPLNKNFYLLWYLGFHFQSLILYFRLFICRLLSKQM